MSLVGWRNIVEQVAVRGHPRRTLARVEVGRWDELVDEGPMGRRSYAVYTPPGLRPDIAVPLIVVLHGCDQSARDAALLTGVNALADRACFVVLYPEQSAHDNPRRCWNWFDRRHQVRGSGEPAEIAAITEAVLSSSIGSSLDRNRVHVMGMSAGGAMAGILAATYPDLYASIAIHSGIQCGAARNALTGLLAMKNGGPDPERQGRLAHSAMGSRARVVPVMVVQGGSDRTVWAVNGDRVVRQWLTTSQLASGQETGLDFAQPHASAEGRARGGLTYSVRSWNDNAGRPVVEYWAVSGLGHAWSGGAGNSAYAEPRGPNATEAMFSFFGRCRLDEEHAAPDVDASHRRVALARARAFGRRWLERARGDDARR